MTVRALHVNMVVSVQIYLALATMNAYVPGAGKDQTVKLVSMLHFDPC